MSQITNLEHERAKEAWSCIDFVNTEYDNKGFKKEYRSIVMKFPTLIITNGLGQSLAFLKSKGKNDKKKPEEKLAAVKKWRVYVVVCSDSSKYTGITNDLKLRIAKHNSGKGAKYTRGRRPVKLFYSVV